MDEIHCTINRIDDPCRSVGEFAMAATADSLFSYELVVREMVTEAGDQEFFNLLVGFRDQIDIARFYFYLFIFVDSFSYQLLRKV